MNKEFNLLNRSVIINQLKCENISIYLSVVLWK